MRTYLPFLIVAVLSAAPAVAEPLIYEGELTGLADDAETVDLRFALFADPDDGQPVWVSDDLTLTVQHMPAGQARFVAELEQGPNGMLQPYHFAGSRWLEVAVLPPGQAAVPLAPRQRVGWTPSSFDPTLKGRPGDGIFLMSVHCGQGAHAEGAVERFDDLLDAVHWLDDKRIAEGTTVRIAVRGDCPMQGALRLAHPDGLHIELVGDPDGLEAPLLTFPTDGIMVTDGHQLGLVQGLRIRRDPAGPDGPVSYGLSASRGALLRADDLEVEGFYYGISAEDGGVIIDPTNDGPLVARANGSGFVAAWGGLLRAFEPQALDNTGAGFTTSGNGTFASGNAIARANGGVGFRANHGSVMRVYESIAEGNAVQGFLAQDNSHMYVDYSWALGNTHSGFQTVASASMDASATTAEHNEGVGYFATSNSVLSAPGSYSVENQDGEVWSERGSFIRFDCTARTERANQLNPDGEPPARPIVRARDADERTVAPVYAIHEGMVDANGCNFLTPADIFGRDTMVRHPAASDEPLPAHVINEDASAPCCGELP
ncbi:MAG: hypothetical protein KC620_10120 [Myxococcales bacterium]|nr:hypothetical protein [Myxococcales bacterium]